MDENSFDFLQHQLVVMHKPGQLQIRIIYHIHFKVFFIGEDLGIPL